MYNQPMGTPIKPQMVIVEGKKDSPFLTTQQRSNQAMEADSERGYAK